MTDKGYAAPELLADTEWLAAHLDDPIIRIVEMGTKPEDFEKGHIPGAVLSEDWHIKCSFSPAVVATAAEVEPFMESLGIGDDTVVIAYDRMRNRDASRLWWVLTYYGHDKVKVLDGGWKKWTLEGRSVETGPGAPPGKAAPTFTPRPRTEVLSTVDTLKEAVSQPDAVIWDIRTPEEYRGEVDRGNKRRGHVPGARHLEWVDLVDEADHTFKPATEIRKLVQGLGITPETPVHVY